MMLPTRVKDTPSKDQHLLEEDQEPWAPQLQDRDPGHPSTRGPWQQLGGTSLGGPQDKGGSHNSKTGTLGIYQGTKEEPP